MATILEMFDTEGFRALKTAVHGNSLRQKLIASNVANIDTPGYKTKDLSFSELFDAQNNATSLQLSKTHPRHMSGLPDEALFDSAIFNAYHPKNPQDGINDVDLDREMVKNNETALNFDIFANLLRKRYSGIKEVLDGTV